MRAIKGATIALRVLSALKLQVRALSVRITRPLLRGVPREQAACAMLDTLGASALAAVAHALHAIPVSTREMQERRRVSRVQETRTRTMQQRAHVPTAWLTQVLHHQATTEWIVGAMQVIPATVMAVLSVVWIHMLRLEVRVAPVARYLPLRRRAAMLRRIANALPATQ